MKNKIINISKKRIVACMSLYAMAFIMFATASSAKASCGSENDQPCQANQFCCSYTCTKLVCSFELGCYYKSVSFSSCVPNGYACTPSC